ncbi:hypothetical protein SOVF_020110 [Spinacia oleracea]|nr:hypothetical protein SOVF_020110 [Spinacia oleracea]
MVLDYEYYPGYVILTFRPCFMNYSTSIKFEEACHAL